MVKRGTINQANVRQSWENCKWSNCNLFRRQYCSVDGNLKISQFPNGYSRTWTIGANRPKEYVLRRPAHWGQYKICHDMEAWIRHLNRSLKPNYGKYAHSKSFICEHESSRLPPSTSWNGEGVLVLRAGKMPAVCFPHPGTNAGHIQTICRYLVDLHQLEH